MGCTQSLDTTTIAPGVQDEHGNIVMQDTAAAPSTATTAGGVAMSNAATSSSSSPNRKLTASGKNPKTKSSSTGGGAVGGISGALVGSQQSLKIKPSAAPPPQELSGSGSSTAAVSPESVAPPVPKNGKAAGAAAAAAAAGGSGNSSSAKQHRTGGSLTKRGWKQNSSSTGTNAASSAGKSSGGGGPPATRTRIDSWSATTTSTPAAPRNSHTTSASSTSSPASRTAAASGGGVGVSPATTSGSLSPKRLSKVVKKSTTSQGSKEKAGSGGSSPNRNNNSKHILPRPNHISAKETNYTVEDQWRFLWETQSPNILDPVDVPAVLDSLMSSNINLLSSVEMTLIQRKVRSIVKALPATKQSTQSKMGLPRVFSGSSIMNQLSAEMEAKSLAQNQRLLNALVFQRIFRPFTVTNHHSASLLSSSATNNILQNGGSASGSGGTGAGGSTTYSVNLIDNAYLLLSYMSSESLWHRTAEVARHVESLMTPLTDDELKDQSNGDKSTHHSSLFRMPRPSIVPDLTESPELPPGITLQSIACMIAMALRGSRAQRLQLLFYLLQDASTLAQFLAHHSAGGVPCWLLEVDHAVVISLASLTHYHYYGNAFLPKPAAAAASAASSSSPSCSSSRSLSSYSAVAAPASPTMSPTSSAEEENKKEADQQQQPRHAFVPSKSRLPLTVQAAVAYDAFASLLLIPPSGAAAAAAAAGATGSSSHQSPSQDADRSGHGGAETSTSSPSWRPGVKLKKGSMSHGSSNNHSSSETGTNEATEALNAVNAAAAASSTLSADDGVTDFMKTLKYIGNQSLAAGVAFDDVDLVVSREKFQAAMDAAAVSIAANVTMVWTMEEFCTWAEEAIDDLALDACMHRLFGAGILPSHSTERELVQRRWQEWQAAFQHLYGDSTVAAISASASGEGVATEEGFDVITHSVRAILDSCNGGSDAPASPNGKKGKGGSKTTSSNGIVKPSRALSSVWGGIGCIDGCGGSGYGVLYCLDKKWWDRWAAYVGWSWIGGDRPAKRRTRVRPGALSTERLLETHAEAHVSGTLGSYEVMKNGLRKNKDYVLIPPHVWDVLYEMYGGGPPLPRMVIPPQRKFTDSNRVSTEMSESDHGGLPNGENNKGSPVGVSNNKSNDSNDQNSADLDELDDLLDGLMGPNGSNGLRVLKLPDSLSVAIHPWVIRCHLCDPQQPYRRGDAGPMSIRIMASPDQPLWRLFVEVLIRFPLQAYKAFDSDGRGKARLWRKTEPTTQKDPVSRYGPWNLLCKNRYGIVPMFTNAEELDENYQSLVDSWEEYTDNATVESVGLADKDHLMLEIAVMNKSNELIWPREAAAKAGRVRRLAEEDMEFRQLLQGVDKDGNLVLKPPQLVGLDIDAMDSTGRWYPVTVLQVDILDDETDEETEDDARPMEPMSRKKVQVDFKEFGGHEEWIDVESDRLAKSGRFTSEADQQSSQNLMKTNATSPKEGDGRSKSATVMKKSSSTENATPEATKLCLIPGFGACGLSNLGNTCYANSAIQCMSYMPLLRSYLLSAQYKTTGDINKDNPLGTNGKLLEEFSELLRIMWSARLGEKSPVRFRAQLGKINSQFSGGDQQDAQEFLNYMLDVLHEDSNKVRKKPYVEALEDDWVARHTLPRVGDASWRRFLRRNRSIMADVAMGQVLNTVTCPVCKFSSRNFDPFNLLSIPIPTVADVIFQCTVIRRATALNTHWTLNKPRKGDKRPSRFVRKISKTPSEPPSDSNVAEQYVIAMSRLADSSDLRHQIQKVCGIQGNRLRLCKAEDIVVNEAADENSVVKHQTRITPLTEKEGPCSQLAMKRAANEDIAAPTHIIAFENTLKSRPVKAVARKESGDSLDDTADEDDEEYDAAQEEIRLTPKEEREIKRQLEVYGDEKECRLVDTDPLVIAKAVSRSLWPRTEDELKLGLRVDARDRRGNWYHGSVIEIIEEDAEGIDSDTGVKVPLHKKKVLVHFDNFSTKWDETYSMDHFNEGRVKPLYSHAVPKPKPTEFHVHQRHTDRKTGKPVVFGLSFYVQCHNEWSNARAGAQILAQASRFLQQNSGWGSPIDLDDPAAMDRESRAQRLYDKTQSAISDLIDVLIDCDREYIRHSLGISSEAEKGQQFRNPTFDGTSLSAALSKKVSVLLHRLPFDVRVATVDTSQGGKPVADEEVPFPFNLIRTIGNFMHARHVVILQWREPPTDKKSAVPTNYLNAPVMYVPPKVEMDKASLEVLKNSNKANKEKAKRSRPGSAGIDLGVCLTEFCKVQKLSMSDNWRCPRCKDYREGRQLMNLWRLPDLLTFHIKRFNMSARWREKITTKVNFPLTGLDLSEWCHKESPVIQVDPPDSHVYDLIGIINHYGSMTGGHYVATCKATACGKDGKEEVAHTFNGPGTSVLESEGTDTSTGWRIGRPKAETNQNKEAAVISAKSVAESAEPLWLQFDDELVEPIPPRQVVSEMAYVLFYRRRRLTPSNVAKYSTLE